MRWKLFGLGALLAGGGLAALYAFRDPLSFAWLRGRIRPPASFAELPEPAPPDYARPEHWAALPERVDAADGAPEGAGPDAQAGAPADVFFVHPTTYYRARSWNQPLDDAETNRFTDEVVIRGAASVFNACCAVYAPRYRQAALYAMPIFDETGDGPRAIELAYQDVEAAFEDFLRRRGAGRPFLVAGHSQGALHARLLLERRIQGSPAARELVAVYAIGYGVARGDLAASLPGVPVCQTPEQLGCFVTWNAVAPGAARFEDTSDHVCVNPLTWRTDGAAAPHAANLGAVVFDDREPPALALPRTERAVAAALSALGELLGPPAPARAAGPEIEPGAADAQCVEGRLLVREIRSARIPKSPVWGDNYHAYDYTLFWMNLRANARLRVERYLARAGS